MLNIFEIIPLYIITLGNLIPQCPVQCLSTGKTIADKEEDSFIANRRMPAKVQRSRTIFRRALFDLDPRLFGRRLVEFLGVSVATSLSRSQNTRRSNGVYAVCGPTKAGFMPRSTLTRRPIRTHIHIHLQANSNETLIVGGVRTCLRVTTLDEYVGTALCRFATPACIVVLSQLSLRHRTLKPMAQKTVWVIHDDEYRGSNSVTGDVIGQRMTDNDIILNNGSTGGV
ncbi:hypothetical protein CLF_113272 [Clonorchis sinensis]|uniref:Uncharacterized protein n=1 Tax=Clonorchis sinensis TaxID=79923 RepID=G7YY22_CLOSI|nr:hypothetical protein CLF_113272 [Clonorchis sinensis]